MGIGALVGGTIASSLIGANSANRAADAQVDAANQANDTQRYIFDTNTELQAPWRETGVNALAEMSRQLGLPSVAANTAPQAGQVAQQPMQQQEWRNPLDGSNRTNFLIQGMHDNFQQARNLPNQFNERELRQLGMWRDGQATPEYFAARDAANRQPVQQVVQQVAQPVQQPAATGDDRYGAFQETPGYQWAIDQGMNALDRNQSARGMRLSGAAMREAMDYQTGAANQEYGNYWNRLGSLAQVGQTATNATQTAGTNFANAYGQNALAAGQARASGYEGVNSAIQGGFNNLATIGGYAQSGMFGANPGFGITPNPSGLSYYGYS